MHGKGLSHNGILTSNIYYIDNNRALLTDWSSVTESLERPHSDYFLLRLAVRERVAR
jgi:hypothetical protein